MNPEISIVPLTAALHLKLNAALALDRHTPIPFPTHAFVRDDELIGAAGIFAPTLMFWARSTLHPRESFELIRRVQEQCKDTAHLVAVSRTSPFYPYAERLGYRRIGSADYFEREASSPIGGVPRENFCSEPTA